MRLIHALPLVIMSLSFGAGIIYAFNGSLYPAVYWIAAGTLNLSVILGMK